jgi:hypothetical protein
MFLNRENMKLWQPVRRPRSVDIDLQTLRRVKARLFPLDEGATGLAGGTAGLHKTFTIGTSGRGHE